MMHPAARQADARNLFKQRWNNLPGHPSECPAIWVIDDLLCLLDEFHQQPAHKLAPAVRKHLVERICFDDDGDSVAGHFRHNDLEQLVNVVVDVLEDVRQYQLRQGNWSNLPVAPEMFG